MNAYSYTQYDALGRIVEVGEITSAVPITNEICRSEQLLSGWVDPITKNYPELTPYQFASNKPIQGIDLDGPN